MEEEEARAFSADPLDGRCGGRSAFLSWRATVGLEGWKKERDKQTPHIVVVIMDNPNIIIHIIIISIIIIIIIIVISMDWLMGKSSPETSQIFP